jgi:hypothetical protein
MVKRMRTLVLNSGIIHGQVPDKSRQWAAAQHSTGAQVQPQIVDDVATFVFASPLTSRI